MVCFGGQTSVWLSWRSRRKAWGRLQGRSAPARLYLSSLAEGVEPAARQVTDRSHCLHARVMLHGVALHRVTIPGRLLARSDCLSFLGAGNWWFRARE